MLAALGSCCFSSWAASEKGLVAHYPFDEAAGTVLHDRSGNGNHGTIKGARWVQNGDVAALEFDGIDDCVDCGQSPSLDLRKSLSMLAWVYPAPPPPYPVGEAGIVGKAFESYVITQARTGDTAWGYISGGPHNAVGDVLWGQWSHVALTYDGLNLRFYLNGKLVGFKALNLKVASGGTFWMGRSDGDPQFTRGAHFRGQITEVRVYNRALSPDEIRRHVGSSNIMNLPIVSPYPIPRHAEIRAGVDVGRFHPGFRPGQVELRIKNRSGRTVTRAVAKGLEGRGKMVITIPFGGMAAGTYMVEAIAQGPSGQKIGHTGSALIRWPNVKKFPHGPEGARRLNNLVTELLNVPAPVKPGEDFAFANPRPGWIYIAGKNSACVLLSSKRSKKVQKIPLAATYKGAHEAMRFLPAGEYAIRTESASNLIVRAIPELVFSRWPSNPKVREWGPYMGEFMDRFVRDHVNTFVTDPKYPVLPEDYRQRGVRALLHSTVPKGTADKPMTAAQAYKHIASSAALTQPYTHGLAADEFGHGDSAPYCVAYAKAVDKLLSAPEFKGKVYSPYANELHNGKDGIELMKVLIKHKCNVLWKKYLTEQRTETAAYHFLQRELAHNADEFRQKAPGSLPRLTVCFGYLAAPPEQADTLPHVNWNTWFEMQFNLVATHPSFEDVGGLMTYTASYADEEQVRWGARLFRHYGIEGNTDMLTDAPYTLTHLENPDFEEGGKGWDLSPAEEGTIAFGRYPGFGLLQGRYYCREGDTVLILKRSPKKANIISQTIRSLEPGRLYSLRMFAGDFSDLSKKGRYAVQVKLDNVDIDRRRSFTTVIPNCHSYGAYDGQNRAWVNYYYRVFRARAKTAKISIADWADDPSIGSGQAGPGGPVGRELMFNFVQVQPYMAPHKQEDGK